ncbi:MAG: hypothetical protein ACXADX_15560 [Candidatus Hodarchaeales archaeon]
MTEINTPEQDFKRSWGRTQYMTLIFLEVASFSLAWVLFMALLKMNGIEIAQSEIFHWQLPLYGKIGVRWWQIETITLVGWTLLLLGFIWLKSR